MNVVFTLPSLAVFVTVGFFSVNDNANRREGCLPRNSAVRLWGNPNEITIQGRAKPDDIATEIVVEEKLLEFLPNGFHSLSALEKVDRERFRRAKKAIPLEMEVRKVALYVRSLPVERDRVIRVSVKPCISFSPYIGRAWTEDVEVWALKDGVLTLESLSFDWAAVRL